MTADLVEAARSQRDARRALRAQVLQLRIDADRLELEARRAAAAEDLRREAREHTVRAQQLEGERDGAREEIAVLSVRVEELRQRLAELPDRQRIAVDELDAAVAAGADLDRIAGLRSALAALDLAELIERGVSDAAGRIEQLERRAEELAAEAEDARWCAADALRRADEDSLDEAPSPAPPETDVERIRRSGALFLAALRIQSPCPSCHGADDSRADCPVCRTSGIDPAAYIPLRARL